MKVRKGFLWGCLALLSAAIAFRFYIDQMPTARCVIVNEQAQTVIKEKGDRCFDLTAEEKAVTFTADGVIITP